MLVIGLIVLFFLMQAAFYAGSALIDGREQVFTAEMTPSTQLANNLSVAVTGIIALLLSARLANARWRDLLSYQRKFDLHRLVYYAVACVGVIAAAVGITALLAPESTGWTGFGITGTTLALLAVTVLTAPLQSTGEEMIFRASMMPAIASWVSAVRPALLLGIIGSSVLFAFAHLSADPWQAGYFVVVGLSTAVMAAISRGLEAPIAFHVANNLVTSAVNVVMASGGPPGFERASGDGGPSYVILIVANLVVVGIVWARERRRSPQRS